MSADVSYDALSVGPNLNLSVGRPNLLSVGPNLLSVDRPNLLSVDLLSVELHQQESLAGSIVQKAQKAKMAAAAYKAVEQRTSPLPIRRMLAEVSGGGKWFGKKGCYLNGALYVRPGGTSKNIIRAGEGKTRFDGRFFGDQLCNHEDMDVDVLYVSKM